MKKRLSSGNRRRERRLIKLLRQWRYGGKSVAFIGCMRVFQNSSPKFVEAAEKRPIRMEEDSRDFLSPCNNAV
jgi:hypothetical protein